MNSEELTCPICSITFDNYLYTPRLIPECGHTLCTSCLESLLVNLPLHEPFICPQDKAVCPNISRDLSSFPKNFALLRILEKHKQSTKDYSTKHYQQSQKKSIGAIINQQEVYMNGNKEQQQCEEHKKKLEYICIEHKCRICTHCAIFGPHKGHDIITEDQIAKEIAFKEESLIDLYHLIEFNYNAIHKEQIAEQLKDISNEKKNLLQKIIQNKFNDIYNLLKLKEKKMIDELKILFTGIEQKLQESLKIPQEITNKIETWKNQAKEKLVLLTQKGDKISKQLDILDPQVRNMGNDVIQSGEGIIREIEYIRESPIKTLESQLEEVMNKFNENYITQLEQLQLFIQSVSSDIFNGDWKMRQSFQGFSYKKQKNETVGEMLHLSQLNFDQINDISDLKIKDKNDDSFQISYRQPKLVEELIKNEKILNKQVSTPSFNNNNNISKTPDKFGSINSGLIRRKSKQKFNQHLMTDPTPTKNHSIDKPKSPFKYTPNPHKFDNVSTASTDKFYDLNKIIKKKNSFKIPDKFKLVFEGLKENLLDTIDFTNAEIGDVGIAFLSEYIQDSTIMKSLKLVKNRITDDGFYLLIRALVNNQTLQTLNLTQNFLTERCLDLLFGLLQSNNSLKIIYLNQNAMNTRNAKNKLKDFKQFSVTINL